MESRTISSRERGDSAFGNQVAYRTESIFALCAFFPGLADYRTENRCHGFAVFRDMGYDDPPVDTGGYMLPRLRCWCVAGRSDLTR
ncbi:MAG: hypothetical protein R3C53_22220 [Pirellulaceae bacterium]